MIYLYRLIYLLLKTFLIALEPLLGAKTKRWLELRSSKAAHSHENCIWLHASSGEIEYAKSLILEIKKRFPTSQIVVTYSSPSAEKLFENIKDHVEQFIPLPWDDVHSIQQLLVKIKPILLIFSRTDLWPELIHQCKKKQIPMGLISYFPKLGWSNKLYLKFLLPQLDFISCVDHTTEIILKNLLKNSQVKFAASGDTRFDQVFKRLEQPAKFKIISPPFANKIFSFGSTWPEDEDQLFPLFLEILKNGEKIILSPHEVSEKNIKRLNEKLNHLKITSQLLSNQTEEFNFHAQVLIIDKIGYLADAYRYSDYAFVGGSFKARVHSVMEPLSCGLPVLLGPHYQNNPEALHYSQPGPEQCVFICHNSAELLQAYRNLKSLPATDFSNLKNRIHHEMKRNQGSSQKIYHFIYDNFLKKVNFESRTN